MYNSIWFDNLNKPFLNPPSWVFTPVWMVLYITIILSLLIYIFTPSIQNKIKGYIFFTIQMILNLLWSPVFFYWKNIGLALLIIILMIVFVILTISQFHKTSKLSAFILVPYLLWIIFAGYLNTAFLIIN